MGDDAASRLMKEALRAEAGVVMLEGEGGLTASIEASDLGPSRMVRVHRDGSDVCWTFSLQADEQQPSFYPPDLPFVSGVPCSATWRAESGISAMWMLPPSPEWRSVLRSRMHSLEGLDLPDEVRVFAERLKAESKAGRIALMRELRDALPASFLERAREAFGDLFEQGLPDEASTLMSVVVSFHEERGWKASSEPGDSTSARRWTLQKEGRRERHLLAMSAAGIASVALSEVPIDRGERLDAPSRRGGAP